MWADENRILPPGSAEPGPWRSARVPFMVPVMEAAVSPRYRRVVLVCGAQMSKTELLLNLIGHRLDDDPAPVIFVGASQRQVESISTSRVSKMIATTPSLREKLDRRKTHNKVSEKTIAGQRLGFAWAGSAIELSSHPAALVLIDERDRMTGDVGGEGDPVSLAEARVATYPDGRVVIASTPTLEGASPIWSLYEGGTQFRWTWPCPECGEFFAPSFDLLKWPEKSTPAQAKREARLACPHCGALIEDRHRAAMNAAGRYEAAGDPESDCASFWISGLASPWRTWGEAAKQWLEAARSREEGRIQAVKNTVFGELFKIQGEAPEVAKVQQLRSAYASDELPAGARVLTCGVDVQQDRLVFAVRAWGERASSWLIRHGEFWGSTDRQEVWQELADVLGETWGGKSIRLTLIDSGFRPQAVYAFAERFPGRVLPSKGHQERSKPVSVSKIDVNVRGKVAARSVRLAHVDASFFKLFIHGRIAWPIDQPGAWLLPRDASEDYCEQLVAEQRVAKPNGRVIWIRTRKDNHYLDAEVLNAAAAHLLRIRAMRPSKPTASTPAKPATAEFAPPLRARQAPPRRRSNWITGWK